MNTKTFSCGLVGLAKSAEALFRGAVCVIMLGVLCTPTFGGSTTGLDFPESSGTTVRFRFTNPLPIYPATYIWRAYPREQPSNWPVTQPCRLPAATIAIFRLGGTASVPVNQSDFLAPADSGSNFRIDSTNCQYRYNLNSRSLEPGSYSTEIGIGGIAVGTALFGLR